MSAGLWVLVVSLAAATAFGLWRAVTDGRLRGTHRITGSPDAAAYLTHVEAPWSDQLGERATLVQFSSAFCAPCRTTRQVLARVAETVPGVRHVEIDAEHHLDLVRELGVMRTPTTLVLDRDGSEMFRATGVPKHDQVIAAL